MLRRRHEGIPSRTYRPENRKAISHRNSAEFIEVPGSLMAAVELLIDWLNYKHLGVTIVGFTVFRIMFFLSSSLFWEPS